MAVNSYTQGAITRAGTVKSDVSDILFNISPTDTPYLSNAGRRNVGSTMFEWLEEALPAPVATNAQVEGDDFSEDSAVAQSRKTNVTQIAKRNAVVTGTQRSVSNYGFAETMAHQLTLAGRILKNDVEKSLVSETEKTPGSALVARKTRGLEHFITTNVDYGVGGANGADEETALTDGTQRALDETTLLDTMQSAYENGAEPDILMVGPYNKRVVSGFTGRSGTQVQVSPETVTKNVTLMATDFGDLRVMINRKQRERTAFLLDMSYCDVAFLRPFTRQEISKIGDADREQIIVEFGNAINEKANAKIADLTTAA